MFAKRKVIHLPRNQPVAFRRGIGATDEYMYEWSCSIPVTDMGFVHGATVTEVIRTFRHMPFRLESHLDRLERSAEEAWIPLTMSRNEFLDVVQRVVSHNAQFIEPTEELGITVFATAGPNPTYVDFSDDYRPLIGVHTWRLPFRLWLEKMQFGQELRTPKTRAIPADSLDPTIKSRSRLHWYIADREVRAEFPQASALLLDHDDYITETSTGNFFVVIDGEILTPPEADTLPGISRMVVQELAAELGIGFRFTKLHREMVRDASEAFTSSTPYCLMPVHSHDGYEIGSSCPGPMFKKLMSAWSERVGVDIVGQITEGGGS